MKRIIALILAVLFVAVMLASCGVKGKYYLYSYDGEKADSDERDDFTIELKKDNKAKIKIDGSSMSGTWSKSGNKVTIKLNGEKYKFTLKGGKLTLQDDFYYYGHTYEDLVFKKK